VDIPLLQNPSTSLVAVDEIMDAANAQRHPQL
jgi:hypothetical protein